MADLVRLTTTGDEITVATGDYTFVLSRHRPRARLVTEPDTDWAELSLLASVDRTDGRDETHQVSPVETVEHTGDRVVLGLGQRTSAWKQKRTVVTCTPQAVEVHVEVEGAGAIQEVSLLGGRAVLDSGAAGTFRSGLVARSVFNPTPTQPVDVVRPATSAVVLGVVGDAEPGRTNAIFSPPPLMLALGTESPIGPTEVPAGRWLRLGVRDDVRRLTFTQVRYEPVDGGYLVRLDYEGHTRVEGSWVSPSVVLASAQSPWAALAAYRDDLVEHGVAPGSATRPRHDWWRRLIFCGWGAQCAQAAAVPDSPPAPDLSRQDRYDGWLARLSSHGVEPGTIVIDDKWQTSYGLPGADPDKWPHLREWIDRHHAEGRRVLLWWRAWAPHGLPVEECIVDPSGRRVAADPTNPSYLARLRRTMAELLGPAGFDADGLKVDFTQRAPSGSTLRTHGLGWGVALLHDLLAALYDAAKDAKADALVITHTPHPSFGDVCDMVRLNDVLESDPSGEPVAAVDQLRFRHAVADLALPDHLVDTDQWPMQTRADWLDYAAVQATLGVPALYYVDAVGNSGEQITHADLEQVAVWWAAAAAPADPADPAD